jgi:hypothetical protein
MLDYGVPGQQALTPRFSLIQSAKGHLRGSGLAGKRWREENQKQNEQTDIEEIGRHRPSSQQAFQDNFQPIDLPDSDAESETKETDRPTVFRHLAAR